MSSTTSVESSTELETAGPRRLELGQEVASVARTLAWAVGGPGRLDASPWLGASCSKRLAALSHHADAVKIADLAERALAIDSASPEERPQLVRALLAQVSELSPPSTVGSRIADLEVRGALVLPGRRRRGRGNKRAAEAAEKPPVSEGGQPSVVEEASAVDAQASVPAQPAVDGGGAERELTPEQTSEKQKTAPDESAKGTGRRRQDERRRGSDRPRAPRMLALGHPDGTGRSLESIGTDASLVEALRAAGIETIADLLLTRPKTHSRPRPAVAMTDDESAMDNASEDVEPVVIRGVLAQRFTTLAPNGKRRTAVLSSKSLGTVTFQWLAPTPPRGWAQWSPGVELALVGVVVEDDDGRVVFEAEPVGVDGRGSGFLPQYGLEGVDERELRDLVAHVVSGTMGRLHDPLPKKITDRHRLLTLDEAIRDAHFPANAAGRGRVRLAFEEFLLMQVGVAYRAGRGQPARGIGHKVVHKAIGQLQAEHGVSLRDGQEIAFSDIRRDLGRSRPMARLIQGDVGAGNTLVGLLAALIVAENGSQVAFVAPDTLAAERTYLHAENLVRSVGVAPLLVGDRINHAQADAISRGEAQIVFGTRSLLEKELGWKRLALVIVEERGQYGTVQSSDLKVVKGVQPDLLVTTRVPIPSSLTYTVFGDLDLSMIRRSVEPRGRALVSPSSDRDAAYAQMREQVLAGRQGFVVLPVKDGRDLLGYADAMRMAEALQQEALEGARIGVYCTDMSREERSRAFDDFQHRRIDVLVCTTYIEDAPMVANATQMLVEYADLHDTIRLHRLRGHVEFGSRAGATYLVLSDSPAADAKQRVERVAAEQDGFRLAELDLEVRGAEAILGERACEMPVFRWALPERDREILMRAREEAMGLVAGGLQGRRNAGLLQAVQSRWGDWLGDILPPPVTGERSGGKGRRRRRRRKR